MSDSVNVNGVDVGPATDIRSLLRDQFLGAGTLAARHDEGPESGIRSLVEAARGTSLEKRVFAALRSLLLDSDLRVRAGTVGLVLHFAEDFDPSELMRILDKNRSLYQGYQMATERGSSLDLEWALMRAIAATPTQDQRVVDMLREALREPNGSWILAGVATNDSEWIINHPQEALDDDPARARILMFRLRQKGLRERFVRGLPRESPQIRKAVAAAVSQEVSDPAEREHLLKLLR